MHTILFYQNKEKKNFNNFSIKILGAVFLVLYFFIKKGVKTFKTQEKRILGNSYKKHFVFLYVRAKFVRVNKIAFINYYYYLNYSNEQ